MNIDVERVVMMPGKELNREVTMSISSDYPVSVCGLPLCEMDIDESSCSSDYKETSLACVETTNLSMSNTTQKAANCKSQLSASDDESTDSDSATSRRNSLIESTAETDAKIGNERERSPLDVKRDKRERFRPGQNSGDQSRNENSRRESVRKNKKARRGKLAGGDMRGSGFLIKDARRRQLSIVDARNRQRFRRAMKMKRREYRHWTHQTYQNIYHQEKKDKKQCVFEEPMCHDCHGRGSKNHDGRLGSEEGKHLHGGSDAPCSSSWITVSGREEHETHIDAKSASNLDDKRSNETIPSSFSVEPFGHSNELDQREITQHFKPRPLSHKHKASNNIRSPRHPSTTTEATTQMERDLVDLVKEGEVFTSKKSPNRIGQVLKKEEKRETAPEAQEYKSTTEKSIDIEKMQPILNLINGSDSSSRSLLDLILRDMCLPNFSADARRGTRDCALRNDPSTPFGYDNQPQTLRLDGNNCHVGTNHNNMFLSNRINNAYYPVDNFDMIKIIPTERRESSADIACKISEEVNKFTAPEVIDLPSFCHQSIYHCLPGSLLENGQSDDPRIHRYKLFTLRQEILRNITGHSIIEKDAYSTPHTGISSCKSGNENISKKIFLDTSIDKNAIISLLEEFVKVEQTLSPVLSGANSDATFSSGEDSDDGVLLPSVGADTDADDQEEDLGNVKENENESERGEESIDRVDDYENDVEYDYEGDKSDEDDDSDNNGVNVGVDDMAVDEKNTGTHKIIMDTDSLERRETLKKTSRGSNNSDDDVDGTAVDEQGTIINKYSHKTAVAIDLPVKWETSNKASAGCDDSDDDSDDSDVDVVGMSDDEQGISIDKVFHINTISTDSSDKYVTAKKTSSGYEDSGDNRFSDSDVAVEGMSVDGQNAQNEKDSLMQTDSSDLHDTVKEIAGRFYNYDVAVDGMAMGGQNTNTEKLTHKNAQCADCTNGCDAKDKITSEFGERQQRLSLKSKTERKDAVVGKLTNYEDDDDDVDDDDGHDNDPFFSFLNMNGNNPYGNEDPDLLIARDETESLAPEDDDTPMQDEMSSPILLNACDRVYHIKRDANSENSAVSGTVYNNDHHTQPCLSWSSQGSSQDEELDRSGMPSQLMGRGMGSGVMNQQPPTDLLSQAMYNAGINEHTIDTLLNSNASVENCFCENDLYFDLFSESNEGIVTTPIKATTQSDSCLPSTSSFMNHHLLTDPTNLRDNEFRKLLDERSRCLDLGVYNYQVSSASRSDFVESVDHLTLKPFSETDYAEENSNHVLGEYSDPEFITSNGGNPDEKNAAEKGGLTLDWEALDFIDDINNDKHVMPPSRKTQNPPKDKEAKRNKFGTFDNDKRFTKSEKTSSRRSDKEAASCYEYHHRYAQDVLDFDFSIGGVILPGGSRERRSKRVRTVEEVKNFDKKYVVPRIVVDNEVLTAPNQMATQKNSIKPSDPTASKGSNAFKESAESKDLGTPKAQEIRKKGKATGSIVLKKKKGRKYNASSQRECIPDGIRQAIKARNKMKETKKTFLESQNTTRVLRSSTRLRKNNPKESVEIIKKVRSVTPISSKRKREISKISASSKIVDKPESGGVVRRSLRSITTRTRKPFTGRIFKATIRPTNVVNNQATKPHKYKLIPRAKRQKCYVVLAQTDPKIHGGTQQGGQKGEEICRNNNADSDQSFNEPPQISTQFKDEAQFRAMKRNLRQQDRDLDRYYSKCQKRPERSSFVNSMIHSYSGKRGFQGKTESLTGGESDKSSATAPSLDKELKLNLPKDTPRTEDLMFMSPGKSDLQPCVLRFVQRMMGNYGDFFSDSSDSTSRERRLKLCNTYLRQHGITPMEMSQLLSEDSSKRGRVSNIKSDTPSGSSERENLRKKTETPMTYHSDDSILESENGSDTETEPKSSQDEYPAHRKAKFVDKPGSTKDFVSGPSRGYSPLPKIKEWRNVQDLPSSNNVPLTPGRGWSEGDQGLLREEEAVGDEKYYSEPLDPTYNPCEQNQLLEQDAGSSSSKLDIGDKTYRGHRLGVQDEEECEDEGNMSRDESQKVALSGEEPKPASSEAGNYFVEEATSLRGLDPQLERQSPTVGKTTGEDVLSALPWDNDVATMLDNVNISVLAGDRATVTTFNMYETDEHSTQACKGDGDVILGGKGGNSEDKVDGKANDITRDTGEGSGDFCSLLANPIGDESFYYEETDGEEKEETETAISDVKRKRVDTEDETAPLASLENMAKEAEREFNSTIAGSLLSLETTPDLTRDDSEIKEFRALTCKSDAQFLKRSSLLQRLVGQKKLGTIQEEDTDDDDHDDDDQSS